jgi:poly(ADP-ribose) glycohydrolase
MPRDYTYAKIFNKSHADVDSQIAKIDCAVNYFNRQINPNEYYITFARKFISNFPDWQNLDVPMSKVYLLNQTNGTEDFRDKIMIDFANKYIGGGALSSGTVQEEIMFHKHVEPIVSILFTEKLEDEEALLIKGTQRFNETKGYKSEFRFVGDFTESVIYDDYNRNDSIIVAIDATYYQGMEHLQYQKNHILREINKAYVGFLGDAEDNVKRDIVTGRWGCGAFAGDEQLKFIIQWIAASATGRDMYFLLWNMKDVSGLDQFIQNAMGFNAKNIYNAIVLAGRCENLLTAVTRILHS